MTLQARVRVRDVRWTGAMLTLRGDAEHPPVDPAEVIVSTQDAEPIAGTADWTPYAATIPRVGDDIRSLTVLLILKAVDGTVWFDEVGLSAGFGAPAGASEAPEFPGHARMSGFEARPTASPR